MKNRNILQTSDFRWLLINGFVCLVCLAAQTTAQAMKFTVDSGDDLSDTNPGDGICLTVASNCTLRAAIEQANALGGADTIDFNFSSNVTISPHLDLPIITDPLTIDGGGSVELSGYDNGFYGVNGIHIKGTTDVTISGLAISSFRGGGGIPASAGIIIEDSSNVNVTGNYIGTDAVGTSAAGNLFGIFLTQAENCTIERNVISGNLSNGIDLSDGSSAQIRIIGNYIGVDAFGRASVGNNSGIVLRGHQNQVGGATAAEGNVISGNRVDGIVCKDATDTLIQYNYIGTDATGLIALKNLTNGIDLINSVLTTIQSNVISGNNSFGGIGIELRSSSFNGIYGNYIGVGADGITPLSNDGGGIVLQNSSDNNTIGSPTSPNIIANSLFGDGVVVGGTGNQIRYNSIYSNWFLGIRLPNGTFPPLPTPNDNCDSDTGPNNFQNFPVISSAVVSISDIAIGGSLNSTPNTTFTLDFYSNQTCDDSAFGEGETYLGFITVTTDSLCNSAFTVTFPVSVLAGDSITATATDPAGNTSEFSLCKIATSSAPSPPTLSNVAVTPSVNENDTATLSGNITDPDAGNTFSLTVDWGDGSTQTFNYPAGTTSFSETHQYLDDDPTGTTSDTYTINLTLSDNNGGGSDTDSVSLTVNNLAPTLSNISAIPSTITVGGSTTVSGDVGTQDSHLVVINWGDGSTNTTINLAAGVASFSATHAYTSSGNFTIGITASDDDLGTANPASVSITVNPLPTLPPAPSNLTATAVSTTQINLTWTDNSSNEDGFKIERCSVVKGKCNFSEIAQTSTDVFIFPDTGLSKNKTYYYRVRAFNTSGDSAYSNTASAKTLRK